jgi:asparagine N-glycosylation enzyme membrane subunit Stt3
VYFAGVMVRLILTLTPCVCILSGIAFSKLFSIYLKEDEGPKDEDPETNEKNGRLYDKAGKIRKMKHEQVGISNQQSLRNIITVVIYFSKAYCAQSTGSDNDDLNTNLVRYTRLIKKLDTGRIPVTSKSEYRFQYFSTRYLL